MAPGKRPSHKAPAKKRRVGAGTKASAGAPAAAAAAAAADTRTVGQRTAHIGNKLVRQETYAKLKRERKVRGRGEKGRGEACARVFA